MNTVILSGNIASEVNVRTTGSGVSTATFRLAVQRQFSNGQGERETDFFDIVTWRKTADFCGKYLAKGRKVMVHGSVQTRSYEAKDGSKRHVTEIIADNVEFADSKPVGSNNAGGVAPKGGNPYPGFKPVEEDEPLPF